jgi:hypothetical protein
MKGNVFSNILGNPHLVKVDGGTYTSIRVRLLALISENECVITKSSLEKSVNVDTFIGFFRHDLLNWNIINSDDLIYAFNQRQNIIIHTSSCVELVGAVTINVIGSPDQVKSMRRDIDEYFEDVPAAIEWRYALSNTTFDSMVTKLIPKKVYKEMYPKIKEPLDDYYSRFIKSSSNILLLIGEPGTGKTTFINNLLVSQNLSSIVAYDERVINSDSLYISFLEGDRSVLVLEDSDAFLSARKDGNSTLHKFLSVSDGLISLPNKKIIFSTNLDSINDVDPALIRKGRCFDIIKFGPLNYEEACALANKANLPIPKNKGAEYTLAELFNTGENESPKTNKVGFI